MVSPVVEMKASVRVGGAGTQICGKGSFVFDSSGWHLLKRQVLFWRTKYCALKVLGALSLCHLPQVLIHLLVVVVTE